MATAFGLGAFFLVFPTGRPWNVPADDWHVDADYAGPLSPRPIKRRWRSLPGTGIATIDGVGGARAAPSFDNRVECRQLADIRVSTRSHAIREVPRYSVFTNDKESLGNLEARNSAMVRAIPDVMFVLRRDGTYVDYHARDTRLLFLPPECFLGRTVSDTMPPPLAGRLMDAIERAFQGDDTVIVEYALQLDDLRHFEARLVVAERDRVLSIVRDVTESKRAHALIRDLAGRLMTSQEAERTRIARELHDGVCQEIASLSVAISHLRQCGADVRSRDVQDELRAVQKRAESVAESVRLLSHGLHSSVLHHVGLVAALQAHCAELERLYEVRIRCFVDGEVEPTTELVALSLFRIAQEALRNSARHGHARHASVSLSRTDGQLTLVVADDGRGFDVAAVRRSGAGLGLLSIEERARLVNGRSIVTSRPGRGTIVNIQVPLDDG